MGNQAGQVTCGACTDEGKALAILVNKWDLVLDGFRKDPSGMKTKMPFVSPIFSLSAKNLFSS